MPKKPANPAPPQFSTPAEAEAAFYDAIERADLDAVMAVWSVEDDVTCIHPGGPRLDGYAAILESWREILGRGSRLKFRFSDLHEHAGLTYAVRVLCEWVSDKEHPDHSTPVFATNTYLLTDRGWRMVLHHASAAPTVDSGNESNLETSIVLH
jgi:ketosteroid isomerase-like protein